MSNFGDISSVERGKWPFCVSKIKGESMERATTLLPFRGSVWGNSFLIRVPAIALQHQ